MARRNRNPGFRWIAEMAWRDSRGQRRLLTLFMLCTVFGIGALVAISSLRDNLRQIIALEARSLLGADLVVQTRVPFTPEMYDFLRVMGGQQAREWRFQSMAVFPAQEASRFVAVRALEGDFPFYGDLETAPVEVTWQEGRRALVEESLLMQLGIAVGDEMRLGEASFIIVGALQRVAGESEVQGFFAPRVYIPASEREATGLLQTGSIVRYRAYLAWPQGLRGAPAETLEANRDFLTDQNTFITTVEDRQQAVERVLGNLFDFLNLVGFVALLLGGLGVGGAVQVYLARKAETMALLRCLGAPARYAFFIYLLQITLVGLGGALVGAALGVATQFTLPILLQSFLPFTVDVFLSWPAILVGLAYGWIVALLFALLPLLAVRAVSPLRALRASIEHAYRPWRDGWWWVVVGLLATLALGFSLAQTSRWFYGVGFAGGLALTLAVLAGVAALLRWTLRRAVPRRGSFALRLALGNLYRPNNRTLFLLTTLGMGAFLINTLYLARGGLLSQVEVTETDDAANVILVDLQPDQLAGVETTIAETGLAVRDALPIVTMRLAAIKDRPMREWRQDPESPVDDWVYGWEFRVSYRDHLLDNATVAAGEFIGVHDGREPVPISIAQHLVEDFGVGVGDSMTWDVQGVPIQTVVSSLREIQWQAGRQNFGVLWPTGVLEEAPVMFAVSTQVRDRHQVAALQQAIVNRFPNISLIDLSLVFATVADLLDRAAFVIQFMAGFTVFTGVVVLIGAMATSRYQRVRESVLLRALGGRAALIRKVLAVEYVIIGLLAGATGAALSYGAAWALSTFVFQQPPLLDPIPGLVIAMGLAGLTLLIGLFNSRGIARHPPLAVLREEG